MSELVQVPIADASLLMAVALQNEAYAERVASGLRMLERRAARGEFSLFREARHVLWHFGETGGMQPGGFVRALLVAFGEADVGNRSRLAEGFPAYSALFEIMRLVPDGADRLRRLVAGEQG